jgi:hypothetical protein
VNVFEKVRLENNNLCHINKDTKVGIFVNIVHLLKIYDFIYFRSLPIFEQGTVVLVHAMRANKGVQEYLYSVLILRLCVGEWSASRPTRFNPRGKSTRHTWDSRSICRNPITST